MRKKNRKDLEREKDHASGRDLDLNQSSHKRDVVKVFELVKSYARQELLDPLAVMPRWLVLGLFGSFTVVVGVLLLVIALLRYLQTDVNALFGGDLSWAPYVIVMTVLVLLILAVRRLINKKSLS